MGRARYIYFNKEIDDKLEEVENVSKLINDLLKNYFNDLEMPRITLDQAKELKRLAEQQAELDRKEQEILGNGKNNN